MSKNPADFRVMLVYPNLPLMLVPALAMGIFTKILKDQGYQVAFFETTQYVAGESSSPENRVKLLQARSFDYERDLGITMLESDMFADFRSKVLEFKPDLLVVSAVEDAFLQAVDLLKGIQDLNIPHIVGGIFPTAAPELCMKQPAVKMIGLGEGESTILEVAERVRKGESLIGVPGTWIRDSDGSILRFVNGPVVNINDSVPDFSLFNERRFYRPMGGRIFKTVPIETYRGCPYACTYCNSPMQRAFAKDQNSGKFLRRKTMKVLRQEMREIIDRYNPEFFYIIDDSFLARPKKEIWDFCDMYEEFKLPFWFNTRPENCEIDIMARLKEVGAYRISFGIECGNEQFRKKVLDRNVSNEHLLERFDIIARSGIPFSVNLIIGFPGETRDLIMDTVEFVRSISGYDTLTVSIFTPYHGTALHKVAVANDWLAPETITKHTTARSILNMPAPYVSADDIDNLASVLPLYCYFPKTEWAALQRAETPDEEGLRLRHHYGEIYKKEFLGMTQDDRKAVLIEGGSGCRSNPKDSFRLSPLRLSDEEVMRLVVS